MMPVPTKPIPAPGYTLVSGKRAPKDGEWFCQFGNGLVDEDHKRTPSQMRWKWADPNTPDRWDIVAVRRVN